MFCATSTCDCAFPPPQLLARLVRCLAASDAPGTLPTVNKLVSELPPLSAELRGVDVAALEGAALGARGGGAKRGAEDMEVDSKAAGAAKVRRDGDMVRPVSHVVSGASMVDVACHALPSCCCVQLQLRAEQVQVQPVCHHTVPSPRLFCVNV